jgi:hypothetical protein
VALRLPGAGQWKQAGTPEPPEDHEVYMKENRTVAKFFAGLLVVGSIALGGISPAQAYDTGWNGTVPPSHVSTPSFRDTGWNGT